MSFPLTVSATGRYLVQGDGAPFLYHADTAWRMPQRLTREEVCFYLDYRVRRGYTTIHLHAINKEHEGPINVYGEPPFAPLDDLTHPHEPYWQHLDFILDEIARRGLLAVVSTAWFGAGGAGWRGMLSEASAYTYGRFLGMRYNRFANMLWVQGGDNDPGDRTMATAALVRGIRETAPHHLHSYHAQAENSSAAFFHEAPWLAVNFAYTYRPSYAQVLAEHRRPAPVRPIILAETGYEDEANTGFRWTTRLVRQQPYWALLSGAAGHAYGSATVWHFGAGWQAALDKPAARQMVHVRTLFEPRAWHLLVPDDRHTLMTNGYQAGDSYAGAACASDGSFALVYVPTQRALTIDLACLAGPVRARWYDPTRGTYTPLAADPLPGAAEHEFVSPAVNGAGDADWVLVLETGEPA